MSGCFGRGMTVKRIILPIVWLIEVLTLLKIEIYFE